jgi:flagellar motor switch protein FliG
LSSLVAFEDLLLLDGSDLRAVFSQVTTDQVVEALAGAPAVFRQRVLNRLHPADAAEIQERIDRQGPVAFEAVASAQGAMVAALCHLSRGGMVAFDDPADMVA